MTFGSFVKELRKNRRLGLREFCAQHGHDPSNWSKIERGALPPPKNQETLEEWASQLGLNRGEDEWYRFFDLASLEQGRIPDDILSDEELVEKLPLFFRTLRGQKPTAEELKKIMEIIRKTT
jgi:transcriptional regulator with XRE-family HTH domain